MQLERRGRLLADRAEVVHAIPEDATLAAAFVEADVRPDGVRMLAREPRGAEVDADLLVGRQREQHVPGGRHSLAGE